MPRFYIGQPVICIDDRQNRWLIRHHPGVTWIRRGERYTIRGNHEATIKGTLANFVTLYEIHNPSVVWNDGIVREASFWEERFEPATDIGELDKIVEKIGEWGKSSEWDKKVKRRVRKKKDDAEVVINGNHYVVGTDYKTRQEAMSGASKQAGQLRARLAEVVGDFINSRQWKKAKT
jgi:hypothetical protein